MSGLAMDDCGTGFKPIPKLGTGSGTAGGVIVIINGQYPNLSQTLAAKTLGY